MLEIRREVSTLRFGCGAVRCGAIDRVRAKGPYGFELDFDTGPNGKYANILAKFRVSV